METLMIKREDAMPKIISSGRNNLLSDQNTKIIEVLAEWKINQIPIWNKKFSKMAVQNTCSLHPTIIQQ